MIYDLLKGRLNVSPMIRRTAEILAYYVLTIGIFASLVYAIAPPAGHDADWNSGWEARDAVDNPPATQPTPAPIVRTILPNENLVAIINAATSGENFKLVAGQTYTVLPAQVSTKVPWNLDATGATVNWTVPPTVATACVRAGYPGVHVAGGTWKTNAIFVEVLAANFQLTDATIVDGATKAVDIEKFGASSGAGAIISGNTFGKTNSVTLYDSESDIQVLKNTFAGSVGEVPIRIDCDGKGVSPTGFSIKGNTIHTVGGANLKGAEIRQGSGEVSGNTFHDYLRVGQGTATAANQFCTVAISGNNWPALPPTSIQQHLMLMAGVTATVTNNDFMVDATMETASISAPTAVTFSGNRRHISAAGVVPRPQLWNPANNRAGGVPVDGGGNVVMPFGK